MSAQFFLSSFDALFKENNISNSDHPSSMIIITSIKLSSDLSEL